VKASALVSSSDKESAALHGSEAALLRAGECVPVINGALREIAVDGISTSASVDKTMAAHPVAYASTL